MYIQLDTITYWHYNYMAWPLMKVAMQLCLGIYDYILGLVLLPSISDHNLLGYLLYLMPHIL